VAVIAVGAACGKTASDHQRPQSSPDGDTTTTPDSGTMADAALSDAAPPTPALCQPGDRSSCGELEAGIKRYVGLPREAYQNTIQSLLGVSAALADLPNNEDPWIGDPNNFYGMERYAAAAALVAALAVPERERLMGCAEPDDACLAAFVESFAPKAFRAPVSADEQAALVLTHQMAAGQADAKFQALIEAILASPRFYTRSEMGAPDGPERFAPLTAWELASKLSYLFWQDMPDDELLAAAAGGELTRTAVLAEQARRMLDDPRAWQGMAAFYREWLHLDGLDTQEKDTTLYPEWSPELAADMKAETLRFLNEVWFGEEPSVQTLMAADFSFVSPALAALYGLEQPDEGLQRVTLPSERRGLLTHASLLSLGAHQRVTLPVRRGLLVRDQLLCTKVPPPPPSAVPEIDLEDPLMPGQERMAESEMEPCAGCHALTNPIGYAFEHFDAVGRYRETLGGRAIDATGTLVDYEDKPQSTFDGAVELAALLAEDSRVFGCIANEWLARASRKSLPTCSAQDATAAVCESGNLRDLMVKLVTTEVFRFVSINDIGAFPVEEECAHRGSTDCQALVAAGAELDLETCEACQGAPCDSNPDCVSFHCANGVYVIRGCCEDEDCASLGTLCAIAGGPNWLCASDYY
jgi:hypothetical protein